MQRTMPPKKKMADQKGVVLIAMELFWRTVIKQLHCALLKILYRTPEKSQETYRLVHMLISHVILKVMVSILKKSDLKILRRRAQGNAKTIMG